MFIYMAHIVNLLNKRQETDVRRSEGVCDVFWPSVVTGHVTSHDAVEYES